MYINKIIFCDILETYKEELQRRVEYNNSKKQTIDTMIVRSGLNQTIESLERVINGEEPICITNKVFNVKK